MSKCILPWISVETTPMGTTRPCCLYTQEIPDIDLKKHTLQDAFLSESMNNLRKTFEDGKKPRGNNRSC